MFQKKDIQCSCCLRGFKRGLQLDAIEYADKADGKGRWRIAGSRKKIYICNKCKNTLFALVRNNLALKTSDIIDE